MRARLAAEYPAAEEALQAGDLERARESVPPCKRDSVPLPDPTDTWVIGLWAQMRAPIAQGDQLTLLRWEAESEGLDAEETRALWRLVRDVDGAIEGYRALMRNQQTEHY